MGQFANIIIRTLVSYVLLIILSRVMGRKFVGEMTVFDFAVTITIGTVVGTFMTDGVKSWQILIIPVVLSLAVLVTGFFVLKSLPARKIIEGEPVVVIQNGKILDHNMQKMRYAINNLEMQLREKNIFDFNEVEFAVLEPNGKLSILKKSQNRPLTPTDLKIKTAYQGMASEIIKDGKIIEQNLAQNNLDFNWLYDELHKKGITKINDVFYASLNTDGSLYIDTIDDNLDYTQKVEDKKR